MGVIKLWFLFNHNIIIILILTPISYVTLAQPLNLAELANSCTN